MAAFSKRAVDLLREVANCSADNLPPYNVRPGIKRTWPF